MRSASAGQVDHDRQPEQAAEGRLRSGLAAGEQSFEVRFIQ